MPLLNPGIVANSPFLADNFTVSRMVQVVSNKGVMTETPTENFCAHGIVNSASRSDLQRLPEGILADNVICVISETQLRGPTPGAQPDIITWRGTSYRVAACDPYPQYGQGWYNILAASQNAIDLMPTTNECDCP